MTKIMKLDKEIRFDSFGHEVIVLVPQVPSLHRFPLDFIQVLECVDGKSDAEQISAKLELDPQKVSDIIKKMLDCQIIKEVDSDG